MKNKNIVIIGGGQTAVYAAKTIRSIDLEANITIISEEKNLAYEKPPLSKDFLLDKISFEKCLFFAENYYLENNIKFIKNEKIIECLCNLPEYCKLDIFFISYNPGFLTFEPNSKH